MNKSNNLYIFIVALIVLVATSVYLFSGVNFSMQFTNTKSDFSYQGATDKTTVTSYYASSGEYIGGASLEVEEGVFLDSAIVIFDNGIEIQHTLNPLSTTHYVLNTVKKEIDASPSKMTLTKDGEVYDVIDLTKKNDELYYFTDGTQSYRHIFINEAGIFLGDYHLEELGDDIKQNIILEFCHKDDSKSQGYHILAKKMISLSKMISGEDLGFVAFSQGANYDKTKDVYVIISWSDTNIVELPLVKGVN